MIENFYQILYELEATKILKMLNLMTYQKITEKEIRNEINTTRNKKTPGEEGIILEMINQGVKHILRLL